AAAPGAARRAMTLRARAVPVNRLLGLPPTRRNHYMLLDNVLYTTQQIGRQAWLAGPEPLFGIPLSR
ncbi:MAG: hypothetical protein SH847_19245, partial [Roseiflexaceae bacterium]|nr:hypothetical protein [Roseiflexaceae bacterium]